MVAFWMNLYDENFSFKVIVSMPYCGIMVKVQMACVCVCDTLVLAPEQRLSPAAA